MRHLLLKYPLLCILVVHLGAIGWCEAADSSFDIEEEIMEKARAFHGDHLLLDSHVDIPSANYATEKMDPGAKDSGLRCDLVKMEKGGVGGVFLAVYVPQTPELNPEGYAHAQAFAETRFAAIKRLTETLHPDRCAVAVSPDDVLRIAKTGRRAIMIGVENGFPLGEDLSRLKDYHDRGARYVTLCHITHNQICDSSSVPEPLHGGLSAFGKRLVPAMNRLGIMCDVSHISEKSFYDVIALSEAPIIASHSGCAAIYGHDRNLTDDQLRALRKNGGVIQMIALGKYLKAEPPERKAMVEKLRVEHEIPPLEERRAMSAQALAAIRPRWEAYCAAYDRLSYTHPIASIKDFADHLDHAVKVVGIDHVGIGTDFDGGGGIDGFQHHGEAVNVTAELLRRGYTGEDLKKIWSGNLLRVWRTVEERAAAMRGEKALPRD